MSSQLTSLVPVLDGTNYQQWASAMQSFLMSQGQWKCAKEGATSPDPKEAELMATWNQDCKKALGNIRLRLHHTIGYQYDSIDEPSTLWKNLKEKYGSPGLTAAFLDFKGIMDTVIPNGSDPSPALDKIAAHFTNLAKMKWEISKKIQAMMILSKAPPSTESIIQLFAQMAKEDSEKGLDPERLSAAMRSSWETHQRSGANRGKNNNQQQANKLSAVKPFDNAPN